MTIDDENNIKNIVRCIVIARAREGATISEIRDDFYSYTGETFVEQNIIQFLLSIPHMTCTTNEHGTLIFNIDKAEKSQHVLNMVKNQKAQTKTNNLPDVCYFKDNYDYLMTKIQGNVGKHPKCTSTNSLSTACSQESIGYAIDHSAYFYDYQLLGDDFFLSMAKMELKSKLKPKHKISQSGLCISGQTIAQAAENIRKIPFVDKNIIINIGSVDILHGHDIMDIERDFYSLIKTFELRGIKPIITTLAPLANFNHKSMKRTLEQFNSFLKRHYNWTVIDLWPCMVNQYGNTLYDCYQTEARYVTGSNQPHVIWNTLGRQRILKHLKSQLADYY